MNCSSEQRLEVHHIVPLSVGGSNELSNLVTLCKECHTKSEGKRIQNEPAALQNTNSYQLLLTPSGARRPLQTVDHPFWRAATVLFVYYGIGSGELCNLELHDYDCSDQAVAEHFEIAHTTNPVLEVVPGRENASSRSRSRATTLPLPPVVERELIRYLTIRPDSGSDRLFLSTAKNWGEPITRDMLAHSLKDRSGERPQAFINCFKKTLAT
ncbi:HNH endonuclease [Natronococcus occultus]|uniref:HNH endonuclease n=1 Tax=Natronococcus occultus TaxID=29288 RepID=UPI000A01694E